jgi:uncharacterized protein YpmB
MKNKKADMESVMIIALVVILVVILSGSLYLYSIDIQDSKEECSNQCIKQNMNFESYTGGGYKNYVCNCLDENKLIKTIYTK